MSALALAALISVAVALGGGGLDLISSKGDANKMKSTGIAVVGTFLVGLLMNWWILYFWTPTFEGFGWLSVPTVNLLLLASAFGLANYLTKRDSLAPYAAVALFVLQILPVIWSGWALGQDNATRLADTATVAVKAPTNGQDPAALYPPSDVKHIVTVSAQNARFKAESMVNSSTFDSRYDLGEQSLVIVKENGTPHGYYIHEVVVNGWWDTYKVNYKVTGFIYVDAENSGAGAVIKINKGLNNENQEVAKPFKLWRGGTLKASLRRHIWSHGYKTAYVDNIRLQVDDKWQPYYTATVNEPRVRWRQSVPKAFLTIDPVTGEIKEYALNKVPDWAEHVYSDDMATTLLDWWGDFGDPKHAPYQLNGRAKTGRYKVQGEQNLVITEKGTLAWQIFMIPIKAKKKASVSYVVQFNTRDRKDVIAYKAPSNLRGPDTARNALSGLTLPSKSGVKYDGANLLLYKIYGRLVYVADMLLEGTVEDGSPKEPNEQPSAGMGLIDATHVEARYALMSSNKGDLLSLFNQQLTQVPPSNAAPGDVVKGETVVAKITSINTAAINGATTLVFTLEGQTNKIFKFPVNNTPESLVNVLLVKGEQVTATFAVLTDSSITGPQIINVATLIKGDTTKPAQPTPTPTS